MGLFLVDAILQKSFLHLEVIPVHLQIPATEFVEEQQIIDLKCLFDTYYDFNLGWTDEISYVDYESDAFGVALVC